jgi:hypothetical protein
MNTDMYNRQKRIWNRVCFYINVFSRHAIMSYCNSLNVSRWQTNIKATNHHGRQKGHKQIKVHHK